MARRLLACTPVIQTVCDLDVLMFLHRHSRALLTTEQLAGFVGYRLTDIVKSLDAFIGTGLLDRTAQPSSHAARLFILVRTEARGDDVRALLELASTRKGRECIREALQSHQARGTGTAPTQGCGG